MTTFSFTWNVPESMSFVGARAISTHEVLVSLSQAPQNTLFFLDGDVKNPLSWDVSVLVTPVIHLYVTGVTATADPLAWVVRTLQKFGNSQTMMRVQGTALKGSTGDPMGAIDSFDFAGVTEAILQFPMKRYVKWKVR